MSRAARARRIARAAAYGGGGLGAAGALSAAALYGLIAGQTRLARRRIPVPDAAPPDCDGTTWVAQGVSPARPPIRMAMLGDSTGAGYGVHRARDTPGVRLAISISTVARRPVHLNSAAVIGAESRDLARQLGRLPPDIDLALIMVGANDVTHRVRPAVSVGYLAECVSVLVARGCAVVVGTCPDLGTVRPLSQPLRQLARRMSRSLAAAQTIAVIGAGGRTVSLADLLGPAFAAQRDLWSDDQFHPSAAGYRAAADALLPSALDALGLRTRARSASAFTTRRARPVARVAAKAAALPGAEVAPAEAHHPHVRRGALARLRRRRPPAELHTTPESAQSVTETRMPR